MSKLLALREKTAKTYYTTDFDPVEPCGTTFAVCLASSESDARLLLGESIAENGGNVRTGFIVERLTVANPVIVINGSY